MCGRNVLSQRKMDKTYIGVPEAAEKADVSTMTIRNWIKDFGIGIKIGGRWKVDANALQDILDGKVTYETQGRPKENN